MILERIDVREIGRKSAGSKGLLVLGMGFMDASFHWPGIKPDSSEAENRAESGSAIKGESAFRNQLGIWSGP